MKNQKVKIAVIVLCVLAAGISYGLSRNRGIRTDGIDLSDSSASEGVSVFEDPQDGGSNGRTGLKGAGPFESGEPDEVPEEAGKKLSESCYIHICGEVVSPGVYELEEGSRIFQAVEKAGGFTQEAAADSLNMAERVSDGMKIVVLNKEEAEAAKAREENPLSEEGVSGAQKSLVNLNTASREELMTLRGIGEAKADDIIRYRESHGGFQKIEDIMKISGIKEAAFQKIKEDITV